MNDKLRTLITEQKTTDVQAAYELTKSVWKGLCPEIQYSKDGSRISNWIPPKGYRFKTFVKEHLNFEMLEPKHPNGKYVLMVHGGGYVRRMQDCFIQMMPFYSEAGDGATVINVDYRVVPEVKCTDLILDVVKGYQWMLKQKIAPSDIIMIGDSSGGGTVLSAGLYMRDHKIRMPAGIISLSGSMDLGLTTQSCHDNNTLDLCFHSTDILQKIYDKVLQGEDYHNPYISPYYGDYYGVSPLMLIVGGDEMMLDDSVHIAETASSQGVPVRLSIFKGMFHDFVTLKNKLTEADEAWEQIHQFMADCFGLSQEVKEEQIRLQVGSVQI